MIRFRPNVQYVVFQARSLNNIFYIYLWSHFSRGSRVYAQQHLFLEMSTTLCTSCSISSQESLLTLACFEDHSFSYCRPCAVAYAKSASSELCKQKEISKLKLAGFNRHLEGAGSRPGLIANHTLKIMGIKPSDFDFDRRNGHHLLHLKRAKEWAASGTLDKQLQLCKCLSQDCNLTIEPHSSFFKDATASTGMVATKTMVKSTPSTSTDDYDEDTESLCAGLKVNGDPCPFKAIQRLEYCQRHRNAAVKSEAMASEVADKEDFGEEFLLGSPSSNKSTPTKLKKDKHKKKPKKLSLADFASSFATSSKESSANCFDLASTSDATDQDSFDSVPSPGELYTIFKRVGPDGQAYDMNDFIRAFGYEEWEVALYDVECKHIEHGCFKTDCRFLHTQGQKDTSAPWTIKGVGSKVNRAAVAVAPRVNKRGQFALSAVCTNGSACTLGPKCPKAHPRADQGTKPVSTATVTTISELIGTGLEGPLVQLLAHAGIATWSMALQKNALDNIPSLSLKDKIRVKHILKTIVLLPGEPPKVRALLHKHDLAHWRVCLAQERIDVEILGWLSEEAPKALARDFGLGGDDLIKFQEMCREAATFD